MIHSHAAFDSGMVVNGIDWNNRFSTEDIGTYKDYKVNGYVSTPNGALLKYNYKTSTVTSISRLIPSDYRDPSRLNNIYSLKHSMYNFRKK